MIYLSIDEHSILWITYHTTTDAVVHILQREPGEADPLRAAWKGWKSFDADVRSRFDGTTVLRLYMHGLHFSSSLHHAAEYGYDQEVIDQIIDQLADTLAASV